MNEYERLKDNIDLLEQRVLRKLYDITEELDVMNDIIGTNKGRIERHCSNHDLLRNKVDKIVKHINAYDNRDNEIITELSDQIAKLWGYLNDSNELIHQLKKEQGLQAKYMAENRDNLHVCENILSGVKRDADVNRELLKRLISPMRFKTFLEDADDIVLRRTHPERFDEEEDDRTRT